jgi:hypothetical protein
MTMPFFPTAALTLIRDNVIRVGPTSDPFSFVDQISFFNPDEVELHRASGGYNSVVEISAKTCFRKIKDQLSHDYLVSFDPQSLAAALKAGALPLHSSALRRIVSDPAILNSHSLVLSVELIDLAFGEAKYAILSFLLSFWLKKNEDSPQSIARSATWLGRKTVRAPASQAFMLPRMDFTKPRFAEQFAMTTWDPSPRIESIIDEVNNFLGDFTAVLTCDYESEVAEDAKSVSVVANCTTGSVTSKDYTADAELLVNQCIGATGIGKYLSKDTVRLSPVIALQGREAPGNTVDEWSDFEVSVFHLGEAPRQCLVIAFDLMPGCHGIVEHVQQFIGDYDFALISDEFVVETICKHKWKIGGFYRQLNVTQGIRFSEDDKVTDATLSGVLTLTTLDAVVIETDSNTGADGIRLAGVATMAATSIVAEDGSVVDPSSANWGEPTQIPWVLRTVPTLKDEPQSNTEIRQFQFAAHRDAYRYLGRPFANGSPTDEDISIAYVRIEAITKYALFLGTLNSIPD